MTETLTVVATPPWRDRDRNPHNRLLYEAVERLGVRVEEEPPARPWRRRCDIWHVHWPEAAVRRPSLPTAIRRGVVLLARLSLARRRGAAVVWTVHNLGPHDAAHPRLTAWFLRALSRRVDLALALSDVGRARVAARLPRLAERTALSGFGPLAEAYPPLPARDEARRRLGVATDARVWCFFGQIRPYKGLPALLRSFAAVRGDDALLLVAGEPRGGADVDELAELAAADPRVRLETTFVSPESLSELVAASDLVVLPFDEILNSGSAILAVTLGRPVLVPRKATLEELASSLGPGWVHLYEGPLTAATLERAMGAASPPASPANVASWDEVARGTLEAYLRARRR